MRLLCCACGHRSTEDRDTICPMCRTCMVAAPAATSTILDPKKIMRLWHDGHPLTGAQRAVLSDLMSANSIAMAAQTWRAA